jgi:hypothetical protein
MRRMTGPAPTTLMQRAFRVPLHLGFVRNLRLDDFQRSPIGTSLEMYWISESRPLDAL